MSSVIKKEKMDPTGVANLMAGVMNRARLDYISGTDLYTSKDMNKKGMYATGEEARKRIRFFLRSEWGKFFSPEDVDPERIIDNWEEQKRYQDWRDEKGCSRCNSKKCPHKSFSYHMDWICEKEEKSNEETVQKVS